MSINDIYNALEAQESWASWQDAGKANRKKVDADHQVTRERRGKLGVA